MADKVDLSLTGQADPSDKNYYLIPIKGLMLGQQYIGKLQWSFEDSALNNIVKNIWSNGFAIDTNVLTAIAKPKLISTNVKRYQGRIEITWSGTDYNNVAYDAKAFKRINVYVRDNSAVPANFVGMGFIDQIGGTFSFPASPSSYTIRITAVSATGLESTWSDEFTVSAITDAPSVPSGLTAAWSGTTFTVSFTHDTTSPANAYLKEYIINLIPPLPTPPKPFPLTPTPGSSQKFSLSLEQNQAAFGDAQQQFTGTVTAVDIYNNRSAAISFTGPLVVTELPVPVITVEQAVNGYSVLYTTPTSTTFDKIHIEEIVSNSVTAPASGYIARISGSSNPLLYPSGTGKRWVRARFSDKLRLYTGYSNVVAVTPIDVVAAALDITPPTTATINSAVWSGNNIVISATVAEDAKKFIIRLTNGTTVGFFTKFASVSGTSQTVLLTEQELYDTLGSYFTSFSGLFVSADSLDNRDSGASFLVAEKTNELISTTPTFTLTAISNGYSVSYILPANAAYAKVYASTVSGFTPNDATNLVYSGASPGIVIDSVYTLKYVKIKYFKTDGSASLISSEQSVTPADPGMLSLIDNEVKISTLGSILAGDSATSGGRAILNKTGLYIYNTGGSPTTQIIANAIDGSPTFLTTNAKIADWKIYSDKIENQLIAGITKFAGLSASGTYAFWAGSTTAGGDAQSVFSVTQDGLVQAKDITISGGSLTVGATSIAASTGILTATSVDLSGKITASTGKIGNLNIDSGALYTGTTPLVTSVTFNSGGIAAYNALGVKAFGLDTSGFLEVKSANINGWLIDATGYANQIRKTSGTNTIKLDASLGSVQADGDGYTAGFGLPDANNIVFWAGSSRAAAPFKVYKDGSVSLPAAVFTGYATTLQLDGKIGASDVNANVTSISGSVITSGIIKSGNFPGTNGQAANGAGYSTNGTAIDLVNGTITSRKFRIDTDGNAHFKGAIEAGTIITTPEINGGVITGSSLNIGETGTTPAYKFSVDSAGNLFASAATISGNITANALTINASNYINSSGGFSFGGGVMTHTSGGGIDIGANFKFSPDTRIIADDNEFAHTSSVTINTNGELTRGRAFYYGSNTIPGASNLSRAVYNRGTNTYTTINFIAGDVWMTVD